MPKALPCIGIGTARFRSPPMNSQGQATTETVLLFPLFMFFLFAFLKVFAMLILVQKMEIASYYGARRWQLESHRNFDYAGFDDSQSTSGGLRGSIESNIAQYLGYGTKTGAFLGLKFIPGTNGPSFKCERTQVWNVCTLEVQTDSMMQFTMNGQASDGGAWMGQMNKPMDFTVTKYVPNRDRPIAFVLPGVNQ